MPYTRRVVTTPPNPSLRFSFVIAAFAFAYSGCQKCADGSDPGADCVCADGKKLVTCTSKKDVAGADTGVTLADEDAAAETLKASGVKHSVTYAGDALNVDFYGCGRIGDSNDVVCVFDLTGSGYDWKLSFARACSNESAIATDNKGREYTVTAATVADKSSRVGCTLYADANLVENVRTEARIRFDGVHSGALTFAKLAVEIGTYSTQKTPGLETLTFRDITLE